MKQTRAARRYAQALMDLAEETKSLDRITEDLQFLRRMMRESRDFIVFLKSPIIKKERKRQIMTELFAKQISGETLSFVDLLAEKGREDILDQIIEQFFILHDERLGIVALDVRAAVEFDADQRRRLEQRFEQLTKKKIRMAISLDKQLRGGFVARVGDTVYDGSVKRQLELLREKFAEGVVHN